MNRTLSKGAARALKVDVLKVNLMTLRSVS
jgi:hypothetical protein